MTSIDRKRPVVLVAIDWYLPAYRAGGPIRSIANLVAALGEDIDFRIVCGNRDLGGSQDLPIQTGIWHAMGPATIQYWHPSDWTSTQWRRILEEVQPDRLYLNSLYSGPFSRLPWKVARSMGVPTTLAPRGMLGKGALSIKPWRKRAWLKVQQLTGHYADITWHASTEQERREIQRWFPKADIRVALNLPVPFDPLPLPEDDGTLHLLSIGRVHPIKNYALGTALAKALAEEGRKVHYRIVGPIEDPAVAESLQQSAIGFTLELLGPSPPSEIRQFFGGAHLILVPSFNENYGHAVAEAVASGRPVIVSDQTVWSSMTPGDTVSCQPLQLNAWIEAAHGLLNLSSADVIRQSEDTYHQCLLDPQHLEAQRTLFLP
ncbi:MAG: glycosyltransferase [Flavobacteriales bacterium]|nr:glycosyltransferase [Flavobacteriales bacterium]